MLVLGVVVVLVSPHTSSSRSSDCVGFFLCVFGEAVFSTSHISVALSCLTGGKRGVGNGGPQEEFGDYN